MCPCVRPWQHAAGPAAAAAIEAAATTGGPLRAPRLARLTPCAHTTTMMASAAAAVLQSPPTALPDTAGDVQPYDDEEEGEVDELM